MHCVRYSRGKDAAIFNGNNMPVRMFFNETDRKPTFTNFIPDSRTVKRRFAFQAEFLEEVCQRKFFEFGMKNAGKPASKNKTVHQR